MVLSKYFSTKFETLLHSLEILTEKMPFVIFLQMIFCMKYSSGALQGSVVACVTAFAIQH